MSHRSQIDFSKSPENGLTRRQLLMALGAGAIFGTIETVLPNTLAPARIPYSSVDKDVIKPKVINRATAFNLTDVRLLESPFRRAQELDAHYLLTLDADRLLHNFRTNAGLTPKAPVYGGWESAETWADIRCQGHTLGHYLSACSLMFAATGDTRFKQRTDYVVMELHECQAASQSGLVCAFPDGEAQFDNIAAGRRFIGVPWYTMHKIFAGLRDAYIYNESGRALQILVKLSDWAIAVTRKFTEEQFQRMLDTEHGGMNEVLADVYALTGEARFLTLAQRFSHRALLTPLIEGRDTLDGMHSNTQIPKVVGFNRLYELTGQADYESAAMFFWRTVVNNRTFVTGGNGDREQFFPPAEFSQHLGSAKTMETCCTYNMLRLTRALFTLDPLVNYADYYERALYNGILASQDPDSGMMTYFQPTRPGYLKFYCTPADSFWCCTGSGMENHAKYGDSIYFHDENSVYINLFIPSTLTWKEKGLTITQSTRFPENDTTQLHLSSRKPVKLSLKVRHPSWCRVVTVKVNGRHRATSRQPGTYVSVERTWRTGDKVEVHLPMMLRTEPLPGSADRLAILYGPIVLAGRLGKKGLTPEADFISNERTIGDVLNEDVEVPRLIGTSEEIVSRIKREKSAELSFYTTGIGRPNDVHLIPYYRIAHERYNLYWKTIQPEI
jgi:uncharacterized protein